MTTIPGVDVSHWQPEPLPWAAWRDRVSIVGIKLTDGTTRDWQASSHLAAVKAAGYGTLFGYHYLEPMPGSSQAEKLLAALTADFAFAVLDVEETGLTEPVMRAFCDYYDAHERRELVLYGNGSPLAKLIAQNQARYAKYGIWWAEYGPDLPTSVPPYATPHVPAALAANVVAWQFAGEGGRLPPYTGAIDLSLWYEMPGVVVPPVVVPPVVTPPAPAGWTPAEQAAIAGVAAAVRKAADTLSPLV